MHVKTLGVILAVIGLFLVGATHSSLAGDVEYQASEQVEAGLKNGTLARDFHFYFSGSSAEPHTIIGVCKTVQFDQSLWQSAPSTSRLVQDWYERIDNPHRSVRDQYFGGYLLDHTGKHIGLWYSKHRFVGATLSDEGFLSISRPFRKDRVPGVQHNRTGNIL